jgi:hypothetical protein
MNPMYRGEVSRSLAELGVSAELIGVESRQEEYTHAARG